MTISQPWKDAPQLNDVQQLLQPDKKVVITTHRSPDGDAIGSSLGLAHFLEKKGIPSTVIVPDGYASFLHWLPGNSSVIIREQHPEVAAQKIRDADIIFCLDFNDFKRIEQLGELVEKAAASKIVIDHHLDPSPITPFLFSDPKASSTAELIYEFIVALGESHLIDLDIAACLYTGIITDTGSFRFSSTSARTHEIARDFLKIGLDTSAIHQKIYDTNSVNRLRLLGYCLSEKLNVIAEGKVAYIALSAEELSRFHVKKGDTEGVVNYALSIEGVEVAALITEKDGKVKLSLRSKGATSVNTIAREQFNGGGHANAAGGATSIGLKKTIELFESRVPDYL